MPLNQNFNLHVWQKAQTEQMKAGNIPTEPSRHYLLDFPGLEAEHSKVYIRRLWLVSENHRVNRPQFLDDNANELRVRCGRAVRALAINAEALHNELVNGHFLEAAARRILVKEGYGSRIWGSSNDAPGRLSNSIETRKPCWGELRSNGEYDVKDEEKYVCSLPQRPVTNGYRITTELRHWMASMIQSQINAVSTHRQPDSPTKKTKKRHSGSQLPESIAGEDDRKPKLYDEKIPRLAPVITALTKKHKKPQKAIGVSQNRASIRDEYTQDEIIRPVFTSRAVHTPERSPSKDSFTNCVEVSGGEVQAFSKQALSDVRVQRYQLYKTLSKLITEMRP